MLNHFVILDFVRPANSEISSIYTFLNPLNKYNITMFLGN